jgi:hypothetical protein
MSLLFLTPATGTVRRCRALGLGRSARFVEQLLERFVYAQRLL